MRSLRGFFRLRFDRWRQIDCATWQTWLVYGANRYIAQLNSVICLVANHKASWDCFKQQPLKHNLVSLQTTIHGYLHLFCGSIQYKQPECDEYCILIQGLWRVLYTYTRTVTCIINDTEIWYFRCFLWLAVKCVFFGGISNIVGN